MANVKVRDFAKFGMITDLSPLELPQTAFTIAKNCRFENNAISKMPVYRTVTSLPKTPRLAFGVRPTDGIDRTIVAYEDGFASIFYNDTLTNASPVDWSASVVTAPFTTTTLADVVYLNRQDRVPWFVVRGGTTFAKLTNWPTDWRAKVLRAYAGVLVGFNMTRGGISAPTEIVWSEFALAGAVPPNWDFASTTSNAGENVLADMEKPIVDAMQLGSSMLIYSENEVYLMEYTGTGFMFNFRRLFKNAGAIGTNCVVEVDNRHYVFGYNDIYVTDGLRKDSIAKGRIRNFIFDNLDLKNTDKCFVTHNPALSEIMFCFPSLDAYTSYEIGKGSNRAAVYNYRSETWYIYDTPLVTSASVSNFGTTPTYATATTSYTQALTTYNSMKDTFQDVFMLSGAAGTTVGDKLYSFERADQTNVRYPVATTLNMDSYLEKSSMDMDELGIELRGYKYIRSIAPNAKFYPGSNPLMFKFGASDYSDQTPVYGDAYSFDGLENYKCDFKAGGRYLDMIITHAGFKDFKLTGFDMDLVITGKR